MNKIQKIIFNILLKENRNIVNSYITCFGRNDGLGAQLHSILSIFVVAKQYNLEYVHTPFKEIDHNRGDEEFLENFFDIGKNESNISSIGKEIKLKNIEHSFEISNNENYLYTTQACHNYCDKFPDNYLEIVEKFKSKFYYKFKNDYINYNNKGLNIGLHIRRGDVSRNNNNIRFTENTYYIEVLNNLFTFIKGLNLDINIHVYSQGTVDDFQEFANFDNVYYPLDEDILTTFYNLIESDILVMSKSSLSYVSALLSNKVIIYQDFWHKPLTKWYNSKKLNSNSILNDIKNNFNLEKDAI